MIWFASSFPDPFDRPSGGENRLAEAFRLQLLRAFNDLVSGDVAVYPVDGRGVIPDHSFDAENQFISSGPRTATLIPYDFTAPLQFASRSGGRAYFDTNGFSQSFGDVVSLGNGSYTLGFYESERADDKFHALKVSVNRDDVKLRYRPGYWRFAAPLRSQTEANAQLLLALDSPFTGSEIRLQVNAVRIPSASHLSITLYIDPLDALLNKQGDKWTGSFQIFCGQRDSRNRVFAVAPREVPLEIPDRVRASGQWLQWKIPIALRKDSKVVRIAVLDDASFRIGSVDVPLESVQ